eukprot:gene8610-biopygen8009
MGVHMHTSDQTQWPPKGRGWHTQPLDAGGNATRWEERQAKRLPRRRLIRQRPMTPPRQVAMPRRLRSRYDVVTMPLTVRRCGWVLARWGASSRMADGEAGRFRHAVRCVNNTCIVGARVLVGGRRLSVESRL